MDDDRARQVATGENLDRKLETSRDALSEKDLGGNWTLDLNRLEAAEIHDFPRRTVDVCEATLVRHALLDGQLATLEAAPYSRSAT